MPRVPPRALLSIALLSILLLAGAPPGVVALPPAPDPAEPPVRAWATRADDRWCSSRTDGSSGPHLVPIGSRVDQTREEGGMRFDVRIAPLPHNDPACPSLDFSFLSVSGAWGETQSSVVQTGCGPDGSAKFYGPQTLSLHVYVDLPEACDAGHVGPLTLHVLLQPLHPSSYVACPVLVCVGVAESQHDMNACSDGHQGGQTRVEADVLSAPPVRATRECWRPQPYATFQGPGSISVVADGSGCRMHLVGGDRDCPPLVREALQGTPWGHLLP